MTIDAHHHLWDPAVRDYPWLAGDVLDPIRHAYHVADLRAKTKESGVDGTVLVQTMSDVAETVDFLGMADANRDLILGVVGWVDLIDPSVGDTLASLRDKPGGDRLVGIRHQAQDEDDPGWLARADVLRGLAAVADAGLVYDLLVLPHQLESAITAVRAVPQGRYVLDHAAKPPIAGGGREPWASLMRELAGHSNVACKLSGLVTEADWTQWTIEDIRPYAETVLGEFGPERVLFGTDWPVCELASGYAGVTDLARELCAGLSAADQAAVFGGNARSWYRLG
ncbi:MAG TPA: amidohydrolase family protein [Pseudonocardiaceae bacterium]|nr:amidohydrolase family protein [Pseudonocardiaceae bacterium]